MFKFEVRNQSHSIIKREGPAIFQGFIMAGNQGQNVWTANFYNAVLMDNDHNNYNQNRFLQMFMVKLLSIIKTEQSIIFSIPPTFWPWRSMLMRNSRGNDKFVTLTNPRGNANLKIVKH